MNVDLFPRFKAISSWVFGVSQSREDTKEFNDNILVTSRPLRQALLVK